MRYLTGAMIGLLSTTAMMAGCATVPRQPPPHQEVIQLKAIDASFPGLKRIIASDYLLGSIALVDPKLGLSGDFSKAQVTVQNKTQNRYSLEYQYLWEDQGGFAVGEPRPWKRFILGPKEEKVFSEMALRRDAKGTTFTVRIVDDTFIELNK